MGPTHRVVSPSGTLWPCERLGRLLILHLPRTPYQPPWWQSVKLARYDRRLHLLPRAFGPGKTRRPEAA
jgi:ABC-type antimicrobial peptide transport system ATPase subunit